MMWTAATIIVAVWVLLAFPLGVVIGRAARRRDALPMVGANHPRPGEPWHLEEHDGVTYMVRDEPTAAVAGYGAYVWRDRP